MNLENENIESLFQKEWLETNGIGGYASSSICGANTRKYHGLLVAAFNPPTERRVLVSKIEERIFSTGEPQDISVNQYPNTIHPKGHQFLKSFERKPISMWVYQGENWKLKKKVFMVPQSNTTVVVYENIGKQDFEIELHPLLVNKNYHSTSHENDFDFYYEAGKLNIKVHAYPDSAPLFLNWSRGEFTESRAWYKNVELRKEKYRGQDFVEDYYRIGYLRTTLKKNQKIALLMTTDGSMLGKRASALENQVTKLVTSIQKNGGVDHAFYNDLLVSGNQFLVNRASTNSKSIIAGYHWFTDWGRDTMIAMRGLTIATGDMKASKSILTTFLKYVHRGLIPNRFPDYEGQELDYNTIDATLWLFVALYEYNKKFKDGKFIDDNILKLEKILLHHIKGTQYNIRVTDEGFLSGGEEGFQLTWMDARVDGYVVTPRIGCPVEINALWYNAMSIYEEFCYGCDQIIHEKIKDIKARFTKNFKNYFLNEEGYLYDVVLPNEHSDSSFRPNQIYAISLPFTLLNKNEQSKIVELVGEKLLTNFGLRTLAKDNWGYIGHYGGSQWERDNAYHQGTVWPFLLMEYWEAFLKTKNATKAAKQKVIKALRPLQEHFYQSNCLHGISEIFDGDNPNEGHGCIQQAWSVGSLLKLFAEYQLYKLDKP